MQTLLRTSAAAIGWLALVLQYALVITDDTGPDALDRTINFFSFFTILTNIVAALAMTMPIMARNTALGRIFDSPAVRTCIATYIVVVGVTYHLLLRNLWDPQGWQLFADVSLHYVTPVLFVLDWLLFVPKRAIPWKAAGLALIYPAIYFGWTLWHGSWSGFYPYPFVDVAELGLERVLLNATVLTAAFLGLCLLLIALGRLIGTRGRQPVAD